MEDSETESLDNKHSGTLCLGYCCLLMKVRMTASKRSFHQTLHVCVPVASHTHLFLYLPIFLNTYYGFLNFFLHSQKLQISISLVLL